MELKTSRNLCLWRYLSGYGCSNFFFRTLSFNPSMPVSLTEKHHLSLLGLLLSIVEHMPMKHFLINNI